MSIPKNERADNKDYSNLDSKLGRPNPKLSKGETAGFYSQEKIAELVRQARAKDGPLGR